MNKSCLNASQLAKKIESLIQWLFQIGLVLELSGVHVNFVKKVVLGSERTRRSVQISVAGVVLTKHAVKRCQ